MKPRPFSALLELRKDLNKTLILFCLFFFKRLDAWWNDFLKINVIYYVFIEIVLF